MAMYTGRNLSYRCIAMDVRKSSLPWGVRGLSWPWWYCQERGLTVGSPLYTVI
ncbi:hypothetical protein BDR05DRAFT_1056647, partial [Suillus weaverae]